MAMNDYTITLLFINLFWTMIIIQWEILTISVFSERDRDVLVLNANIIVFQLVNLFHAFVDWLRYQIDIIAYRLHATVHLWSLLFY